MNSEKLERYTSGNRELCLAASLHWDLDNVFRFDDAYKWVRKANKYMKKAYPGIPFFLRDHRTVKGISFFEFDINISGEETFIVLHTMG